MTYLIISYSKLFDYLKEYALRSFQSYSFGRSQKGRVSAWVGQFQTLILKQSLNARFQFLDVLKSNQSAESNLDLGGRQVDAYSPFRGEKLVSGFTPDIEHLLAAARDASRRLAQRHGGGVDPVRTAMPDDDQWKDRIRNALSKIGKLSSASARNSATEEFFNSFSSPHREDSPEYDQHITEAFLSVADSINDAELFWRLAGAIWIHGGVDPKRWLPFFNDPKFRRLPTRKRIALWNERSEFAGYAESLFDKWRDDRPITVYRTFRVRDGKSIRASNDRNSDGFYSQIEGSGFSYSLSRIYAIYFSTLGKNEKIIEKYAGADPSGKDELLKKFAHFESTYRGDALLNRAYLGKYHIRKRDIISLALARHEDEIVSVESKLISYQPITFDLFNAAAAWEIYFRRQAQDSGETELFIKHKMPEQKLLNFSRKLTGALMNQNPEAVWNLTLMSLSEELVDGDQGLRAQLSCLEKKVLMPMRDVLHSRGRFRTLPALITYT